MKSYGLFSICIFGLFLVAQTSFSKEDLIKKDEMNGIKLADYKNFEKKWKLVTVRFRKDTGEMRFTYANDLAYKNLLKGSTNYPEGSIFSKIGIKTTEDKSFPSSAVPAGARRYQFMVRNKKKFASTDGWGYALFDKEGLIFPETTETQSVACAACHRIVPERGFVFSELMDISYGVSSKKNIVPAKSTEFAEKIKFNEVEISKIPDNVKAWLPKDATVVQKLEHQITRFLFQGTLDEIKPALTAQSIKTKMPTVLISDDNQSYALVYIENKNIFCDQEGKKGYFIKAVSFSVAQKDKPSENRYCWPID
jgi:hypothetical protein